MSLSELSESLCRATRTVRRFINGELSAAAFLSEYANFYYYEALDGHEISSAQDAEARSHNWIPIDLHRRIQEEVVNKIAVTPIYSPKVLEEAGRINEIEARERARAICAEKGLEAILEQLENFVR